MKNREYYQPRVFALRSICPRYLTPWYGQRTKLFPCLLKYCSGIGEGHLAFLRKRKCLLKMVYFNGKIFMYISAQENGVHDKIRLLVGIDERKEYNKNSIKDGGKDDYEYICKAYKE